MMMLGILIIPIILIFCGIADGSYKSDKPKVTIKQPSKPVIERAKSDREIIMDYTASIIKD
jgi:hypothetical protein